MALPFLSSGAKRRDQIVLVDLGSRNTKAVYLQRKGDVFHLVNFVITDAPVYDRSISAAVLGDHLKKVAQLLGSKTKQIGIALGPGESLLRHADMPLVPLSDMRAMIKHGSKNYLQQDLPGHSFDCFILPMDAPSSEGGAKMAQKCRVLVGGAKSAVVHEVKAAAKEAGLMIDFITSSLVGPANAFEMAMPDVFAKEVVALVDFGYKNSTISIMHSGRLELNRVVGFGAAKLTTGIAESLGITNAEAENIKVGMPHEVDGTIQPLLTPLGRELRASIDFFEHQHDTTVSQIFFSGGTSRSDFIIEALQAELMVPCKSWNPTAFMALSLPPEKMGEIEHVAPQLTVVTGAAVSLF